MALLPAASSVLSASLPLNNFLAAPVPGDGLGLFLYALEVVLLAAEPGAFCVRLRCSSSYFPIYRVSVGSEQFVCARELAMGCTEPGHSLHHQQPHPLQGSLMQTHRLYSYLFV
jgi:hypothetical protein